MKKRHRKNKILFTLLLMFVFIQAFQPKRNGSSPSGATDISKVIQVPDTVHSILQRSCYDCHSNKTIYPWYANISPVSWWLAFHVEEGKEELNFSTFAQYLARRQAETLKAIAVSVKKDEMPLPSYLWMHKDAILTPEQKEVLVDWAEKAGKELPR